MKINFQTLYSNSIAGRLVIYTGIKMKRFSVFLSTIALVFGCVACSSAQTPLSENFLRSETENMESATSTELENSHENEVENMENMVSAEPEKINEAKIAQQAYDWIDSAESLCKSGMGIISSAWHFGIWDAPECGTDVVMERLSAKTGFAVSFIEENGGYTVNELVNGNEDFAGWEFCLMTAENCLSAAGTYTSVNEVLDAARDLIRELSDDYVNYQYLKDYYTKVAVYAAYFENVSGSYNDLIEAIAEYESNIQKAKEPLLFDFR